MAGYFMIGEQVYLSTGIDVMEVHIECTRHDRYIVSYSGSTRETVGYLCVSGNRLYRTHDEAMQHVRKHAGPAKQIIPNAAKPGQGAPRRKTLRADEPGDGWGRRS